MSNKMHFSRGEQHLSPGPPPALAPRPRRPRCALTRLALHHMPTPCTRTPTPTCHEACHRWARPPPRTAWLRPPPTHMPIMWRARVSQSSASSAFVRAGKAGGLVPKTTAAAANSAAARTGLSYQSHIASRSNVEATLPPGVKSICIGADGTGGCGREQEKIIWQLDEKDRVHFVTQPHCCRSPCSRNGCFRPCVWGPDGSWTLASKEQVRTTSAVTAPKMAKRRCEAGLEA